MAGASALASITKDYGGSDGNLGQGKEERGKKCFEKGLIRARLPARYRIGTHQSAPAHSVILKCMYPLSVNEPTRRGLSTHLGKRRERIRARENMAQKQILI